MRADELRLTCSPGCARTWDRICAVHDRLIKREAIVRGHGLGQPEIDATAPKLLQDGWPHD